MCKEEYETLRKDIVEEVALHLQLYCETTNQKGILKEDIGTVLSRLVEED